ncbi:SafA/ExsA family spore coat assembly protein [Perspicuibacillus lycopersici]|uniref:SafA/ExsA family spore coat assembly protein n=1 Tax=Perspicuibacillus lycopersici TaxID=1325689 RepID=UPI002953E08D|nr:SafA/ExsA family spore coat assembly protein [Perspicuibacillus lycopersici]
MKIHIVQKGDTLWKIAQKYGVDFEQLKSMNTQLSNPDMIMPGMKIKVPSSSGTVKKEMPTYKKEFPVKEMPIQKEKPLVDHPFAQEKPITLPAQKEAPKVQKPKEIIKEVPKPIFIPKAPQPVIPEIDINNYYMLNMANMNVQQQPQVAPEKEKPLKPTYQMPTFEEESEDMPEAPKQPVVQPEAVAPPMYPCQPCVPMTPVLPGSGIPCWPIQAVPFTQPMFTQPMMQQPFMQMPAVDQSIMPMDSQYMNPTEGMNSQQSFMQQPNSFSTPFDPQWEDDMSPDDSNVFNSQMPLTPVQGVNDMSMGYPAPTFPMMQPNMVFPGFMQNDDCGCGGSSFPPVPYALPSNPSAFPTGMQPMMPGSGAFPGLFPTAQQPSGLMDEQAGMDSSIEDNDGFAQDMGMPMVPGTQGWQVPSYGGMGMDPDGQPWQGGDFGEMPIAQEAQGWQEGDFGGMPMAPGAQGWQTPGFGGMPMAPGAQGWQTPEFGGMPMAPGAQGWQTLGFGGMPVAPGAQGWQTPEFGGMPMAPGAQGWQTPEFGGMPMAPGAQGWQTPDFGGMPMAPGAQGWQTPDFGGMPMAPGAQGWQTPGFGGMPYGYGMSPDMFGQMQGNFGMQQPRLDDESSDD